MYRVDFLVSRPGFQVFVPVRVNVGAAPGARTIDVRSHKKIPTTMRFAYVSGRELCRRLVAV
jgi:hypothetical protein